MLLKTTETGIQSLIYLMLQGNGQPVSPRRIAEDIGASPTYMKKITSHLVKANILRAHRGICGGVTLSRDPSSITLLEILEACQGKLLGDYCQETQSLGKVCSFHKAMYELHQAIIGVLSKWTLAELAGGPEQSEMGLDKMGCRIHQCLCFENLVNV